ncbi:AMP-binding protein [Nonomuraea sp. NPDC026600]|uniref:class I adenylate-forming enzyme family protein n=1 Tax=Nonomuraea sp. NPDC026600 TaxID=3155363 RepID=UPI0033E8F093
MNDQVELNTDHRTLEFQARRFPGRLAVVHDDKTMTYAELDQAADMLVEGLSRAGLGPRSRIGVRMRPSIDWLIVNRAIGKLGAEQLALNPQLTTAETVELLDDARAEALITADADHTKLAEIAAHRPLKLIVGAADDQSLANLYISPAPKRVGPPQTPILIYTSGTTGKSKGVSFHDRLPWDDDERREYQDAIAATPPHPEGVRVLLTLPVHHAAGAVEATVTHQRAGTLYLLPRFKAEEALDLIERHRIQHWMAVPTMLLRIKTLLETSDRSWDLTSLESIYVGAAPVPPELKRWVLSTFGPVLWEQYGSTEAAAMTRMAPEDFLTHPTASGRPFPHVTIEIVDEHWRPKPIGEEGEITARTPGLVGAYLGQGPMGPETLSPRGFFKTGDTGRLDEDGYLYVTGRSRDMIVSGGVNIYPAEIEAVLQQHPDIQECAVIGVPDPDMGEKALVVLELKENRRELAIDDIQTFLSDRLAKYKHPRAVEIVPQLPRNPMGKILKPTLRTRFGGA